MVFDQEQEVVQVIKSIDVSNKDCIDALNDLSIALTEGALPFNSSLLDRYCCTVFFSIQGVWEACLTSGDVE